MGKGKGASIDAEIERLLNHTALRDIQIKAYWLGMMHSSLKRDEKIDILCERYNTGYKNVEKVISTL